MLYSSTSRYMREAIAQALKAMEEGEVPVGAVIVNPALGEVVSRAGNSVINSSDPSAHAEVLVIREACNIMCSERLIGFDIYTTLEPCSMCASVISMARIRRIYYGATDPIRGSIEGKIRIYSLGVFTHTPEVYGGILEKQCSKILNDFFCQRR